MGLFEVPLLSITREFIEVLGLERMQGWPVLSKGQLSRTRERWLGEDMCGCGVSF